MRKVYSVVLSVMLFPAMGYASDAIKLQEFVYEKASFPSCHASTLVEVATDHILAAWFGGTDEGENDVGIWISHRENDSWSEPVEVAQHDGVPCWNPVLWKDLRSGQIVLFYKAGPSPETWTGFLRRSEDGGKSWSEVEQLPAGILGPIRAKPYQLDDGTLLCGSSVESWQAWGSRCEITPDLGKTWDITNPINLVDDLHGIIQPTLFRTGPNSLRILARSRKVRRIATATSDDNGMTWSQAVSIDLPNPSAGIDAVNVDDDRVALIYNHTERGRGLLNIAISEDRGETWKRALDLENDPGKEFSYPAMILTSDGMLSCTYTWHREKIRFVKVDPKSL
jgi:predicted neuraminidase